MRRAFFLLCVLTGMTKMTSAEIPVAIIPQPVKLSQQSGEYLLPKALTISYSKGQEALAGQLKSLIGPSTGISIKTSSTPVSGNIQLVINAAINGEIGKEGYQLTVSANGVRISANEPAGLFYGIQSLLQLFPKEIEQKKFAGKKQWRLPFVQITDYPRFGWRGLMFDVARHFYTIDQVKAFIDDMVRYKFNLLHLHLTDDEGWRIEIKGLPKLTEVGAWNVYKVGGNFGEFTPTDPNEPRTNGGYYTQQQLKDLVAYAKQRFVDILPEVDVPGHSMAAVASYPELSGTPGDYKVLSGEKFVNYHDPNGEIPGQNNLIVDNTVSPANEQTYVFLDKVFGQLAEIFPFEYIHMGGDECIKNFWLRNAAIKELMQKEGLKDMDAVQSYFVTRVQKIIQSKGKKMIGWDEILQGGLAPNAVVMSWRGFEGGIAAAKLGHDVVMCPYTHVYLDLMQGDEAIEAPVYATVRLKDAYSFELIPDGVDPKFIKGGQANIWTEKIYNTRHLQYMLWPRTFAIAESVWSPKEGKNWNGFISRVEEHFRRFDEAGRKYATSMYEPIVSVTKDDKGKLTVALSTEVEGIELHYSFDNSFPDSFYPKYSVPLPIPKDMTLLRVIGYRNGKQVGRLLSVTIENLQQRVANGN